MNRLLAGFFLVIVSLTVMSSCKKDQPQVNDIPTPDSPVSADLLNVPYDSLSQYGFFIGDMKDQMPVEGVIEYKPASKLFTDYAYKKRFIWMPGNMQAKYNGDHTVLDFPVGTILIKNFYYEKMQPGDEFVILETRLMIKKYTGWVFAEYIWNDAQTEAYLDMNGSNRAISFIDDNDILKNANYRFPSETECLICHKFNEEPIPIGLKPQSINFELDYNGQMINQLQKLVDVGYLEKNIPSNITSVVDYSDPTQDLELRLRSYLDMNCAHCHSENSHCDYRPLRLAFSETSDKANMGLCIPPDEVINPALTEIIVPSNTARSVMHYRLSSTVPSEMMPLLGRSIVHTEAVDLLEQWINLQTDCN